MGRIIFQHISQIIRVNQIIDPDDLDVPVLDGRPENQAPDASKSINAYFYHEIASLPL
jgi:hypothetical protein